jgi:putative phage-type endonuclease
VSAFTIIGDSKDREKWLAARKLPTTVGASDVASVLGLSRFKSAYRLACEKTGELDQEDFDDNECVFWGNQLEDAIADGFGKRTAHRVVPFGLTLQSVEFPWLTATPDAFCRPSSSATHEDEYYLTGAIKIIRGRMSEGLPMDMSDLLPALQGWRPLQIKNIGTWMADHWRDGVPDYYEAQCRTEAIVCGVDTCIAAGLVAGNKLVWDEIKRSEISDRQIVNMSRRFTEECVAGRLPAIDGSESTRKAIGDRWPSNNPKQTLYLDHEWLARAAEIERLKRLNKDTKSSIDEIENRLRAEFKDASEAILPDGSSWTYKQTKTGSRTLRRVALKGGE